MNCCKCGRYEPGDYTQNTDGTIVCGMCEPIGEPCEECGRTVKVLGRCNNCGKHLCKACFGHGPLCWDCNETEGIYPDDPNRPPEPHEEAYWR